MRKKILSMIIVVGLIVQFCLYPVAESHAEISFDARMQQISEEATQFIRNNMHAIQEVAESCSKELKIESSKFNDWMLGTPFMIYDLDLDVQEETFFYPLIDKRTGKVFLIASVIGTSVGWQYSINKEMVDELNQIEWPNTNCIFYQSEGKIIAQTKEKKYYFSNRVFNDSFDDKTFEAKKKVILDDMTKMEKVNISEEIRKSNSLVERYSPTVTSEMGYYYCNLNNAQGQHGRQMCWAASVATIVNYIKGTNYTAWDVCNTMGIGYDQGAAASEKQQALARYGINYVEKSGQSSFSSIMSDIGAKRPIAASTTSSKGGHAVTVYGYRNISSGQYVMMWDSNANSGQGDLTVVAFRATGTTFTTGSVRCTWVNSLVRNPYSYK